MIGAAYQAIIGFKRNRGEPIPTAEFLIPKLACEPYKDAEEIYGPMVQNLRNIVATHFD